MSRFKKAERKNQKLKLAIYGPSGSGKTYSSLMLAESMGFKKIAVIDSEKSAALYDHKFNFDVCELGAHNNSNSFIQEIKDAFKEAIDAGYDVVIIDSLTHLWEACLTMINQLGGRYTDWGKVTPKLNEIIDIIVRSDINVIVTMRAKTAHEVVKRTGKDGKETYDIERKGIEVKMRDGIEYEFTTIFRLNMDHTANTIKDRTGLFDHAIECPIPFEASVGKQLIEWLGVKKVTKSIVQKISPKKEDGPKVQEVPEDADKLKEEVTKILAAIKGCETSDDVEAIQNAFDGMDIKDKKILETVNKYINEKRLEMEVPF